MIIRPIEKKDLESFEKLALTSSLGITNLPKNRTILEKKINDSLKAFSGTCNENESENYIFVLENLETGKIAGTCGIMSKRALTESLFFYKIGKKKLKNAPHEIQFIKPISYKKEFSEVAALYLHPDVREGGFGKLLSLSRFLFISAFKKRFQNHFFAEIRGVIDEKGYSPFWEGIGRHFYNVEYAELMKLTEPNRLCIQTVLPKTAIYLPLLPKEVQNVIGKPHERSYPALSMLNSQGFKFQNLVDILDGGPQVVAKTSQIKTIKESRLGTLNEIIDEKIESEKYLIGNERLQFRAGYGYLRFLSKEKIVMNKQVADSLSLSIGDKIRYITFDLKNQA